MQLYHRCCAKNNKGTYCIWTSIKLEKSKFRILSVCWDIRPSCVFAYKWPSCLIYSKIFQHFIIYLGYQAQLWTKQRGTNHWVCVVFNSISDRLKDRWRNKGLFEFKYQKRENPNWDLRGRNLRSRSPCKDYGFSTY